MLYETSHKFKTPNPILKDIYNKTNFLGFYMIKGKKKFIYLNSFITSFMIYTMSSNSKRKASLIHLPKSKHSI